jgi:hypothetical protein
MIIKNDFMALPKMAKARMPLPSVLDEMEGLRKQIAKKDQEIKKLKDEIFELVVLSGAKKVKP